MFAFCRTWRSITNQRRGIVSVSAQEGSEAWRLITEIHDTYWLVNIVDNDYVNGHGLEVFDRVMNRQAQCSESD
jgi:hypothetical protein